jgi:glycoside hydrolase-like protein
MGYWLDYSAAKIPGSVIKAAGYSGVIRYIDSPNRLSTKHTSSAEYRSHLDAGLQVQLVMQTTTTASTGGFVVGVEHAQRALAGANMLNYPGPIYFTNDRPELPNPLAWKAYLDGAASVIGKSRVGAYGFRNAMDAAVGHANWFWQAGRRSDVASFVHFWQDNNTQVTVSGITCDRNLPLKQINSEGFLMALSDQEQRNMYDRIFGMLRQRYYKRDDAAVGGYVETVAGDPAAVPATVLDTLDGNLLRVMLNQLGERTNDLEDKLDALETALTELSTQVTQLVSNGITLKAEGEITIKGE